MTSRGLSIATPRLKWQCSIAILTAMTSDARTWRRRRLVARVTPPDRPHALEDDGSDGPAVRELHVTVPLKPQGDAPPANLPPTFARALQDEYAVRYLSRLGASATPENVAMVLEHLPLEGCQLTAAWRARGALADELTIDLYPPKPTPVAGAGGLQSRAEQAQKQSESETSGGGDAAAVDGGLYASYFCFGPVCWSFDDMKRKFLPPFCEATLPASEVRDVFTAIAIDKRMVGDTPSGSHASVSPTGADIATSGPTPHGATVSQILRRRATLQREQCANERRVPPDTRRETICAMHRAFFSALPLVSLGLSTRGTSGMDRDLAQRLLDALVTDVAVVELVQNVVLLLYHEVFVPVTSATIQAVPNSVETLLVESVRLFTALRGRYGSWKAPSSFTANASSVVPMLLLALRVDVETLFRMQYPQSFSSSSSAASAQMHRVLAEMNARISRLLDPDTHWSRVPVLESSCAAGAARTAPTFQRQRRRLRLRDQFFRTSEALHCVFPVPAPGSSRRIMAVGGGTQVARYYSSVVPTSDHAAKHSPEPVSVETKLKLLRVLQHR
jgi:hypothetical protein